MNDNDRVRKSISATLAEIEITHGALGLLADHWEITDAFAIIDCIEARLRSHEPLPQIDPKKLADFAEN